MQSKILVTGGAGYIGAHTVHHLLKFGVQAENITVLDNLEIGHAEFVPGGVRLERVDLRDKHGVSSLLNDLKPDCIIHFAGYAYVGESMHDPMKYFNNNVLGGINLLSGMQQTGCKNIVFSSSCSVYGASDNQLMSELTLPIPENPYAESKLIFEKMLKWASRINGINYAALRYFNAAGSDYDIGEWHEPEPHLIPLVLAAALNSNLHVDIYGDDYETPDGTCIRDYVHVTDLANAHYLAMQYLLSRKKSLVVNLGTGVGTSVMEIVNIVETVSGERIRVEMRPRRSGDVARLVANNSLAKSELGWSPERDIKTIIQSALNWQKSRGNSNG
jgi:UDP-glucose 4-epimerase